MFSHLLLLHLYPSRPEARPEAFVLLPSGCLNRRALRHVRWRQPELEVDLLHWRTSTHPNSLNLQPWMAQQKGCKIGLPLTLHNGWLSYSRAAKSKAKQSQALSLTADNL